MTTWLQFLGFQSIYSYHITKDLGGSQLFWWPISGFGQFCTVERDAMNAYENEIKKDPSGSFELVRFPAVTRFRWKVIGITGEKEILRTYSSQ